MDQGRLDAVLRRLCAVALLGAAAGCGGGGGGGGGGDDDSAGGSRPPGFYETTEYRASHGLGALNASSAYAAGATGAGVRVAVIDTGVDLDHPELAGRIAAASTDIVSGDPDQVDDIDGHGTTVAGIIAARRNGALAHGVAFQAEVLAVRADAAGSCLTGCAFDESDVAAATDYAVDHGAQVINYSLGGASSVSPTLQSALAAAADAGVVLVLAAGNDAQADPTFPARFAETAAAEGLAIAVGAVDADDQLASFSNRAGSARQQFLVAPGVGILAPALGGGAAMVSGTSFSTPHVSGAAALVLQAAPFLRPAEVVELLLESATDLGAPGTDAVYGRGLLNLSAALGPQGTLGVPLGDRVEDARADPGAAALQLGPAFGAGPKLGRVIFLDGYGRPYWLDLDDRVRSSAADGVLDRWLRAGSTRQRSLSLPLGPGLGLAMAFAEPARTSALAAGQHGPVEDPDDAFALELALDDASGIALSRGFGVQQQFGLQDLDPGLGGGLISQAALASPYLALADRDADGLVLKQAIARDTLVRIGILGSTSADEEPFERAQRSAVVGELVQRLGAGRSLALQGGTVEEQQSLLDARGGGALGLPERATTSFVGLSARWALTPGFALFGQGSLGLTAADDIGAGLLDGVSQLRSSSFALGASARDLVAAGDRLTVALAQPLRVDAGSATLDRPVGRSFDGQIQRRSERVDLAPDGRELDLEVGYRLALDERRELSLNWLTRLEPNHQQDADPAHAIAVRLRHRF